MNRQQRIVIGAAALAAILLCLQETTLAQCPMCRTALLSSVEGQQMARGFNSGILFLLCAPFVIVGTIIFLIVQSRQ